MADRPTFPPSSVTPRSPSDLPPSRRHQRDLVHHANRLPVADAARLLPTLETVYQIFYRWRQQGLWQRLHDALIRRVRRQAGRTERPTVAIIESQSVKTTHIGGDERGYDAAKKTKGRKRHIVVDTLGLVLAVAVHSAGDQDQCGGARVLFALWQRIKHMTVIYGDTAYGRAGLPKWILETLGATEALDRGRTFAWLGFSRRHSKDYERNPETSEALIQISMIHLMLQRLDKTQMANTEGDISERARKRAAELANEADARATPPREPTRPRKRNGTRTVTAIRDLRLPSPGTSLIRQYKGRTIEVRVLDDEFEFDGERYKSLSAIAKAVTGSHCNGFRFFKLGDKS
ncbi:Transposase DDE domain protein [Durusdinium trenchii]|uniref:Transposase DDE domain protein n=1 Tax=Durusdinium trenchii TaxID=1381693 RepID=A0ABP0NJI6_9DINO